jgi:glycosyltransferase involved in cell wall biosynthesis
VLTPNKAFRDRFVSRGCPPSKIHIIMNSPQEDIFASFGESCVKTDQTSFVVMFHGVINERSGLHIALEAINIIRSEVPGLKFEIYGEGESYHKISKRIEDLNLKDIVTLHGRKPLEEIAKALRGVDVGISPNIMSPFTNINLPTRIMECISQGKPVIAPKTEGILDYFDGNSLYLFEPGDVTSLANTLLDVFRNPQRRREIAANGEKIYSYYRWELQSEQLVKLVTELTGHKNLKETHKAIGNDYHGR